MRRIGVLGAGAHSTRMHGPALARCRDERPDDIELRAVCDLDPGRRETYADEFGFEATYESVDGMLAAEPLDAVVAVTPVSATREVAADLLTRDVAVLVEKPPGETPEEARELAAVAERHGADHAVSFNRRFNPAVRRARSWIAENAPERPPTHAISRLLRVDRSQAAFVTDTGIHAADTVCSFLGAPRCVSARVRPRSGSAAGERCVARATFAAGSGTMPVGPDEDATAQFALVPDAGCRTETCELLGPGYDVRIDVGAARLTVSAGGDEAVRWELRDDAPVWERNGTLAETRAFLDAVGRGEGFGPSLSEGARSLALAAAVGAGGDRELAGG